jgi:retinol dehydrogenase 12
MGIERKIVLITGANSGIGAVTAREIAKSGATVIMACRNMAAAETVAASIGDATANRDVHTVKLDLASFRSVRECAARISTGWSRIDVLINNAGTYTQGDTVTEDGIHPTMQTNYFSPFLLTNLLMPLLRASPQARIVNVSSAMYKIGRLDLSKPSFIVRRNGFSAYAASKLAMLLFTFELSERLACTRATVNALHPGLVATKIMTLGKWYDALIRPYIDANAVDAETGALTSIHLALAEEVEGVTGKYFVKRKEAEPDIRGKYLALRRPLWEKTCEMTDVDPSWGISSG